MRVGSQCCVVTAPHSLPLALCLLASGPVFVPTSPHTSPHGSPLTAQNFLSMLSLVDIMSGLWPYAHNGSNTTVGGWWNDMDM